MSKRRPFIGETTARLLLVAGFAALFVAVAAAFHSPADGYELSIYAGTPPAFWVGAGLAMLAALVVAFAERPGANRALALVLGGETTAAVVGLPVLRRYRFNGTADALTHLGWTRDLAAGVQSPLELFYPGVHVLALVVQRASGLGIERSLLVAVLVGFLVVLVFVPLAVRATTSRDWAVVAAAFAGFLLLPINTISTHASAHPFTQTTLLSALVLYLLVRYVRLPERAASPLGPAAIGLLLALAGVAVVLFHPQQAANLLVVFVAVSLVQFAYRRHRPDHTIARHRPLYGQTALLAAAFVGWSFRFDLPLVALETLAGAVRGYLTGNPPTAGRGIQTQGESLAAIGVGLPEIFAKLFLVGAVFAALAGGLMLAALLGRLDEETPESNAVVVYLTAGVVAVAPLFAVYLVGSVSEQYFRHFGFIMLLVTVLGTLALVRLTDALSGLVGRRAALAGVALAFAVVLPLSLAAVFPSPWVYQPTQHVSDAQLAGYETALSVHDAEDPVAGVRQGPWRYSHGIVGVAESRQARARVVYDERVPPGDLDRVAELFDEPTYLAVSQYDREREVRAYAERRYSSEGFDSLDAQPGVDRVHANGEVELYYVD